MLMMLPARALARLECAARSLSGRSARAVVRRVVVEGLVRASAPGRPTLTEQLSRVEPRDLRVPSADHPTVQAAVDAARSGDRIAVAPGRHEGGVVVRGKRIAVWGRGGDRARVVLQRLSGDVIDVRGEGAAASVSGLTLSCPAGGSLDAIPAWVREGGRLALYNCDVWSRATLSGVVAQSRAELAMRDCVVHDCVKVRVVVGARVRASEAK